MSDSGPIDLYEVPEDQRLDVDEPWGPNDEAFSDDLDLHRTEFRGEVDDQLLLASDDGFESAAGRFASWVEPEGCTGSAAPGAEALSVYLRDRFEYSRLLELYGCRKTTGKGGGYSEHAEGRAIDLGIPTTNSGKARPELGDPVVELLIPNAGALGIQILIYNRRSWSARKPSGGDYKGSRPHYDHVHIGLIPDTAARLNYATIEAMLGGMSATTPELDGVTHRVEVDTRLNVRDEPTTSSTIVTKLRDGARVAALDDPPHDDGRYRWVRIKAVSGPNLVTGWVADEFLVTEEGAPAPRPEPAVAHSHGDATHRVTAKGLNLRSEATTSAAIIVELPNGTEVTALPGPARDGDGYRWIKIRASYRGNTHEGWVASKYLDPIG